MYALYSRADSNQERPMMARIRYAKLKLIAYKFKLEFRISVILPKTPETLWISAKTTLMVLRITHC